VRRGRQNWQSAGIRERWKPPIPFPLLLKKTGSIAGFINCGEIEALALIVTTRRAWAELKNPPRFGQADLQFWPQGETTGKTRRYSSKMAAAEVEKKLEGAAKPGKDFRFISRTV
jgi:hypothetical protein